MNSIERGIQTTILIIAMCAFTLVLNNTQQRILETINTQCEVIK